MNEAREKAQNTSKFSGSYSRGYNAHAYPTWPIHLALLVSRGGLLRTILPFYHKVRIVRRLRTLFLIDFL